MTRPTDEEIKEQALHLANLLIRADLSSESLTTFLNDQITRGKQERLQESQVTGEIPAPEIMGAVDIGMIDIPAEEREAVELASKATGQLHLTMLNVAGGKSSPCLEVPSGEKTRNDQPARPSFNDPAPGLRIQNHPCAFTPEEQIEAIPEQILIRKEREPVEVVLRFQAFGISSKGDLLQGQGRNEWAVIDLSEPSEALTHEIIHALKLCPMLPTVFSLVTAENVQALFRAFAAGCNHRAAQTLPVSRSPAAMREIRHG